MYLFYEIDTFRHANVDSHHYLLMLSRRISNPKIDRVRNISTVGNISIYTYNIAEDVIRMLKDGLICLLYLYYMLFSIA